MFEGALRTKVPPILFKRGGKSLRFYAALGAREKDGGGVSSVEECRPRTKRLLEEESLSSPVVGFGVWHFIPFRWELQMEISEGMMSRVGIAQHQKAEVTEFYASLCFTDEDESVFATVSVDLVLIPFLLGGS
ncbi:hypothetical protein HAX54_027584 [Datura stramonium]|uniref:Uncharacterized protein n=1 Tax=Datura stramonium TaxID=4076 RepID=A0ABS8V5I1_DATST|nr:hypothetical protein [Datura stramonium]